eukprot:g13091.t1
MLLLLSAGGLAEAKIFDASPDGTPYSIGSALAEAGPGDTVVLADGEYDEAIVTVQGGERGNPLTITGGRSAVINAEYHGRLVLVQHSWVTIEGFTVDGKIADADEAASYANKGVFVDSGNTSGDETLEGFVMREMSIINCGDECVRLKNFVVGAELSYNEISNCGVRDFVYGNSGKNGEGIYVGTSSTQWDDGPDGCSDILISRNVITPNGNECVDIKEGSTGVIVEENTCASQLDKDCGCFGSRGDGNTFRNNHASECVGVGVRIGGWEVDGHEYGRDNSIYGNTFTGAERGALSFHVLPQGTVCGNSCEEGACDVIGSAVNDDISAGWDQPCDSSSMTSAVPLGETDDESNDATPSPVSADSDDATIAPTETPAEPTPASAPADSDDATIAPTETPAETTPAPVTADDAEQEEEEEHAAEVEDDGEDDCEPIPIEASYVKATSGTQAGNGKEHLVDGIVDNRWSAEGDGSWFSIELPEAEVMSGMKLWFEDGDERQASFTTVCVGEGEVVIQEDESSMVDEGVGQFFPFREAMLIKSIMIVGYGNTINDWNSVNEIQLCRGDAEASRKLLGR